MDPINQPSTAISADWHASRYYLYGRNQVYRYLSASKPSKPYQSPATAYDFSTRAISGPEDRGPQTVEQLITQGYFAVPAGAAETAILSDKRTTAWLGLDDVIQQVQRRIEIYERNIYEIELAQCSATNSLFAWEAQYSWPASPQQQYILGKRLQELYADRRRERIMLWKDVSRLRQELPESAQRYLSAYRKIQILEDLPGDIP